MYKYSARPQCDRGSYGWYPTRLKKMFALGQCSPKGHEGLWETGPLWRPSDLFIRK